MYKPIGYDLRQPYRLTLDSIKALFSEDAAQLMALDDQPDLSKFIGGSKGDKFLKELEAKLGEITAKQSKFWDMAIADLITIDKPWFYIISHYLTICGRIRGTEYLPKRPFPRTTPVVPLDEIIDVHLSKRLNPLLLPKTERGLIPVQFQTLVRNTFLFCQHVVAIEQEREDVRNTYRAYVNHIAWKVKNNYYLSQEELTRILLALDPNYGIGGQIHPAKNELAEFNASRFLETIREYTQPGPYSNFVSTLSTGSLEHPIIWMGPWTPNLIIAQGYCNYVGKFKELDAKPKEIMTWEVDDIFSYYTDQVIMYEKFGNGGLRLDAAVVGAEPILDNSDIRLVYDQNKQSVRYEYQSALRNRPVRTTRPEEYIVDRYAKQPPEERQTSIENQSMDKLTYIDDAEVEDALVTVNRSMDIWIKRANSSGVLEWKQEKLGLKAVLPGGNCFITPINGYAYRAHKQDLMGYDEEIVAEAQGALGLTNAERKANKLTITIQYRAWKLKNILKSQMTYLEDEPLEKYVKTLGGE